jgi:hypothetical protein
MTLELDQTERALLLKVVRSYLSDLRQTIAATQRHTEGLHEEEDMLVRLQDRL